MLNPNISAPKLSSLLMEKEELIQCISKHPYRKVQLIVNKSSTERDPKFFFKRLLAGRFRQKYEVARFALEDRVAKQL